MITSKLKKLILFLLTCVMTSQANAGSQQREGTILPIEDIAVLSKMVEKYAAEQGARVFFIGKIYIHTAVVSIPTQFIDNPRYYFLIKEVFLLVTNP